MAIITLRSVKAAPLTNAEIDANFTNINNEVATKLTATSYNAADVLTKIKTVDGAGSGLDADLLDGYTPASTNTSNSIVLRDASGNFSAGTITASLTGNISGNAATVTNGIYTNQSYNNPTWLTGLAGSKVTAIPNTSLTNSSVTINGVTVALGGSISISGSANIYTAQQTFRDNLLVITDETDTTKILNFQLSGLSTGTTRVLAIPDETGTIATRTWAQNLLTTGFQTSSLGVGTPAPATTGEIRATNQITAYYSDRRLKENIAPISDALNKVLSLNGVTFTANDVAAGFGYINKNEQVGVIAQEVEAVLPQIVVPAPFDIENKDGIEISKSGENYKTVQYEKLVPLLIEAIKELNAKIDLLQKQR